MDRLHAPRAFLVAAVLLAVGAGVWSDRNSPRYAVEQMISALQMQEPIRLEAFVDESRLAETLVDQANQQMLAAVKPPGQPDRDLDLGMSLGRGGQVEITRASIREAINRLTDPERGRAAAEKRTIDRMKIGRVRRTSNAAEVEIQLPHPNSTETIRLTARLELARDAWRLVSLDGLSALAGE